MQTSPKRKFLIPQILSKEQLLQKEYSEQDEQNRCTKIICSVNDKTNNYETIREMILAGANGICINSAYIQSRRQFKKLYEIRKRLEQELSKTIPINLILRGGLNRVGNLSKPEINLRQNQEIRLCSQHRIIGDENIIPVDQHNLFANAQPGNRIFIDYSQVQLVILRSETMDECLNNLKEIDYQKYSHGLIHKQDKGNSSGVKKTSNPNSDTQDDDTDFSGMEYYSKSNSEIKNRLQDSLKEYKKRKNEKTKVLVCRVLMDCILRAFKPLYLYDQDQQTIDDHDQEGDERESGMEEGFQESHITNRDIGDISCAKKYEFDSLTISGITRPEDVQELRALIGNDSTEMKIYVRITRKAAVENFENIMNEADACIIARAYIAIEEPFEDVIKQQSDMINLCRGLMKPVIISTQILESSLSSYTPSFTEMGDISNLVRQGIDGIQLSSEITYGNHPVEVIKALRRACLRVETLENKGGFSAAIYFNILSSQWIKKYREQSISSVLSFSAVETAHKLKAKVIVAFTSRGETAIKLAKLRPPCQIIAITSSLRVCRFLNSISGVVPYFFGSLYGIEILIQKVTDILIRDKWAQSKDYIVVLLGTNEHLQFHIDTMQIIQI